MRFLLTIVVASGCCASAFACLWDRDTLAMERQRFPTTLELITGKFLRHSSDFYEWRVEETSDRLELQPTPELYDDLAVAYEKLGRTDEAIRIIEQKASLYPGLYSTHANLGTFFFHAGNYESGLKEIDKALAINPDAHFGREVYQKRLVEYLLSKRPGGSMALPLSDDTPSQFSPTGFGSFVIPQQPSELTTQDKMLVLEDALKGVLGMMKFGNYDSPVLLEVLGDLLVSQSPSSDAKQLAARAYLKASYGATDPRAKKAYRKKADAALKYQTRNKTSNKELSVAELERQFKDELEDAQSWYETLVRDEQLWIDNGVNVQEAFDNKYYEAPIVLPAASGPFSASGSVQVTASWVGGVLIATICIVFALRKYTHRNKVAEVSEND